MEIILTQNVANLGAKDTIIKVKDGYARNYLIPQGFAISATPSNLKQLEETIRQRAHKEAKNIAEAQAYAAKISAAPVKVAVKVNEQEKIYGAVTAAQVADAFAAAGIEVDKKNITLPEIKELGEYEGKVKCYRGVFADIKIEVVAE